MSRAATLNKEGRGSITADPILPLFNQSRKYVGLDEDANPVHIPAWARNLVRGATEREALEHYLALFPDLKPESLQDAVLDFLYNRAQEADRKGLGRRRLYAGGRIR